MFLFRNFNDMSRGEKMRHVASQRKIDAQFVFMSGFLVILCYSLPYFPGSYTHDRIRIRVVVASSCKHIGSQGALFQSLCLSCQSLLDDEPEKRWIPLAVPKMSAANDSFELLCNLRPTEPPICK